MGARAFQTKSWPGSAAELQKNKKKRLDKKTDNGIPYSNNNSTGV